MAIPPRAVRLAALLAVLLAACSGGGGGGLGVLADGDGDGLPDRLERTIGSDPRDPDSPVIEGADDDDTPEGPGPDALPDGLERWLRLGGARTPVTARSDTDGDGVPDYLEVGSGLDPFDDDDPLPRGSGDLANDGGPAQDGISDAFESYLARRGARTPVTAASDSDGDGIPDALEARSGSDPFDALDPPYARAYDLDGDQVPDWLEIAGGSDPLLADFPVFDGADDDEDLLGPPGDGLLDGLEGWLFRHGAATPVTTATDSDADGAPDAAEIRAGTDPFDATSPLAAGAADRDRDGIPDALEELLLRKGAGASTRSTDSDGDAVPDFAEAAGGSDPFSTLSPTLFARIDLDGDGIDDFLELEIGADRLDPDSPLVDGDADADEATGPAHDPLTDALEALLVARGSTAPVTTYSDADGDGVPDFVELRLVSDPLDADSPRAHGGLDADGDGLTDAVELVLGASPAGPPDPARNSDSDVIPDAVELVTGTDWRDGASPRPGTGADADGDGALDHLEIALGTDPLDADDPLPLGGADADEDGLSDALEALLLASGTAAPVTPGSDTDGDGLADYLEVELASDRHDPDHPVVDGGLDVIDRTGPSGDGLSDALEHFLVAGGAHPPVTTRSDTDGDELPDYLEAALAFDPFDAESPLANGSADDDGDGVSNALEIVLARLGAAVPVDGRTDSDADGAPDHLEIFAGADAFDADSPVAGGAADSDGDGLSDALEAVLVALGARAPVTARSDTDGDGIPDLYEVRSGTHPVRGDHPLAEGGLDVIDATGPADTISDALEHLLVLQGASAPVTRANESDGDGAPDHLEVLAGAWPFDGDEPVPGGAGAAYDADGDRMPDALEEVLARLGAVAPLDTRSDTDGDGAGDHFEVVTGAHPLDSDVPVSGGAGGRDVHDPTGPPGDRISDALEKLLVQIGCVPPIRATNDVDGDGLPDWFEARSGTGVLDGDSPMPDGGIDTDDAGGPAGDGMSDALEAFLIANGATGPVTVETDTDGDGVPDYFEVFKGSDPFDALDAIPPGTKPVAAGITVTGIDFEGRTLTGGYTYVDAELDPEGVTTFRWLRDGVPIPGETALTHVVAAADLGTTLTFEVTPVSRLAYPPESAVGVATGLAHPVPVPSFPRGQGGPGGIGVVTSDLRAWLRADEGVETIGADVELWRDLSGWGRDAVEVSAPRRPELVADSGTGRPALRFDGASHLSLPRPVEDDLTLVAVFATTSSAGNGMWWLSPAILGGETAPPCTGDYHLGINSGKPLFVVSDYQLTTSNPFANGLPHALMATRVLSNGRMRLYVDGAQRGSIVGAGGSLQCPMSLFVGSSTATEGFWTGDLFELSAFDRVLSTAERALVGAALAARWDTPATAAAYDHAATHGGDVAGIGRDSATDEVLAAEGAGILRVANPSLLSDGDYLVWGTDAPLDFTLADDVPPPYPNRLRRTWTFTVTDGGAGDGVGTVDLRFRVGGLFLSRRVQDFALLLDDDGDFSDARVIIGPSTYDAQVEAIEFQGVELGPERYVTLAVVPL